MFYMKLEINPPFYFPFQIMPSHTVQIAQWKF